MLLRGASAVDKSGADGWQKERANRVMRKREQKEIGIFKSILFRLERLVEHESPLDVYIDM